MLCFSNQPTPGIVPTSHFFSLPFPTEGEGWGDEWGERKDYHSKEQGDELPSIGGIKISFFFSFPFFSFFHNVCFFLLFFSSLKNRISALCAQNMSETSFSLPLFSPFTGLHFFLSLIVLNSQPTPKNRGCSQLYF